MSFFAQMEHKDRRTLLIGAALAGLLVLFSYGLLPLWQGQQRLTFSVPEKRLALAEMRAQAQAMGASQPTAVAILPIQGSLLSFIDAQARQAGLGEALKRLEPVGDNAVRLNFEKVEFERLARLLDQLHQSHGLRVSELSLNADVSPGQVTGQIKLERGNG